MMTARGHPPRTPPLRFQRSPGHVSPPACLEAWDTVGATRVSLCILLSATPHPRISCSSPSLFLQISLNWVEDSVPLIGGHHHHIVLNGYIHSDRINKGIAATLGTQCPSLAIQTVANQDDFRPKASREHRRTPETLQRSMGTARRTHQWPSNAGCPGLRSTMGRTCPKELPIRQAIAVGRKPLARAT